MHTHSSNPSQTSFGRGQLVLPRNSYAVGLSARGPSPVRLSPALLRRNGACGARGSAKRRLRALCQAATELPVPRLFALARDSNSIARRGQRRRCAPRRGSCGRGYRSVGGAAFGLVTAAEAGGSVRARARACARVRDRGRGTRQQCRCSGCGGRQCRC